MIKVKLNPINKIIKDHGIDKNGRVIKYARDSADRLMNVFVPMESGTLRRNKMYPSNSEIKYNVPYAKYIYYGKLMLTKTGSSWAKLGERKVVTGKSLKYHTSGTGAKWDRMFIQRRSAEWSKDIQNFIK